MSTTFGVIEKWGETIPIARRVNREIFWTNELASMLPDDTKVIPLDNTSQGIYTIGDIKEYQTKQNK